MVFVSLLFLGGGAGATVAFAVAIGVIAIVDGAILVVVIVAAL